MYADSRFGSEGQETYLYSVAGEFRDAMCLSFWLYFKSTKYFPYAMVR